MSAPLVAQAAGSRRPRSVAETLVVDDLHISFQKGRREVVRAVSFVIEPGEALGLIGESGSGKSMTAKAILGLLPLGAHVTGSIRYGKRRLLDLRAAEMQRLRGSTIAMIFQDPLTALNPVLRVGDAIAQVIVSHDRVSWRQARLQAVSMMERVGIHDAPRRMRSHPYEFSGGMRQRIVIAMALAAHPTVLLADEPTTALDMIVQTGILRLLDQLRREEAMSLLLVSHDFGVVAGMCDRVGVMYHGELVEEGPTRVVLFEPRHPYTIGLLDSLPTSTGQRLRPIPGTPPDGGTVLPGCAFAPRCRLATQDCTAGSIPFVSLGPTHRSRCIHIDKLADLRSTPIDTAGSSEMLVTDRPEDATNA
jgi:oligopeptide/dipeptide ABC transporter ATP-binding protein